MMKDKMGKEGVERGYMMMLGGEYEWKDTFFTGKCYEDQYCPGCGVKVESIFDLADHFNCFEKGGDHGVHAEASLQEHAEQVQQ